MKALRTLFVTVFVLGAILLVLRLNAESGLCTGGDEAAGYPYFGDPEFQLMPLGYRCVQVRADGARHVEDPDYIDTGIVVVMALCAVGGFAAHRRHRLAGSDENHSP